MVNTYYIHTGKYKLGAGGEGGGGRNGDWRQGNTKPVFSALLNEYFSFYI